MASRSLHHRTSIRSKNLKSNKEDNMFGLHWYFWHKLPRYRRGDPCDFDRYGLSNHHSRRCCDRTNEFVEQDQ